MNLLALRAIGIAALAFGIATLKEGGSVLFIDGASRAAAGDYVPFVLWFNFIAGFFYILAGVGIVRLRPWSVTLSRAIAAATWLVFAALGIHIALGGSYETRTVLAMTMRSAIWSIIAIHLAWRLKAQTG